MALVSAFYAVVAQSSAMAGTQMVWVVPAFASKAHLIEAS